MLLSVAYVLDTQDLQQMVCPERPKERRAKGEQAADSSAVLASPELLSPSLFFSFSSFKIIFYCMCDSQELPCLLQCLTIKCQRSWDWVDILPGAALKQSQHFSPEWFSSSCASPETSVYPPPIQYSVLKWGHFCTSPRFPFYDTGSP